jgi:hypothetical protein
MAPVRYPQTIVINLAERGFENKFENRYIRGMEVGPKRKNAKRIGVRALPEISGLMSKAYNIMTTNPYGNK